MDYEERKMRISALRLRERKSSQGNWGHFVGAVNCMNERHKVIVTKKGRLVLSDHKGKGVEEIRAMLIFNPEVRCRCLEVKKIWKWFTATVSPNFYALRQEEPWIRETFLDRDGCFSAPSTSKLLSCLPAGIREAAEFHRSAGGTRKAAYVPLQLPDPALADSRIKRRFVHQTSRSRFREHVCLQRAHRTLMEDPILQGRSKHGFDLGYVFKRNISDQGHFFKPWFRAITKTGAYPGQLPPSFMWERDGEGNHYPTILRSWACTGKYSNYAKEWRIEEIWVKVRWSDQHGYVVERERFTVPEGQ